MTGSMAFRSGGTPFFFPIAGSHGVAVVAPSIRPPAVADENGYRQNENGFGPFYIGFVTGKRQWLVARAVR